MTDERREATARLMDEIEVLVTLAKAYNDPALPHWRRVLNSYRRAMVLRRAGDLIDVLDAVNGKARPAEKWLGMGRRGWQFAQFGLGVLNAWSGIDSAAKGQWFGAVVSFFCVIVTAHWRLPYAPPRHMQRTKKGKP